MKTGNKVHFYGFWRKKMDFGIFINPLRAMSFWKNGFFKEEKNETYAIFNMS